MTNGDDVAVGHHGHDPAPSTTGSGPFSFWMISLAASTTLIEREAVAGSGVMTSHILGILLAPFNPDGVHGCSTHRRSAKPKEVRVTGRVSAC